VTHLLDAHTLIWSQDDPSRLGTGAATALRDPVHELVLGTQTIWEISIKVGLGKLKLSKPFRLWINQAVSDFDLIVLPIGLEHIERQMSLPLHHRDPFDRMLAAQSLVLGIPIIGNDGIFAAYGVTQIWK
jgi:PIN domain nuclease of toxin-antitoxin system